LRFHATLTGRRDLKGEVFDVKLEILSNLNSEWGQQVVGKPSRRHVGNIHPFAETVKYI
jgi:hypothetical protein